MILVSFPISASKGEPDQVYNDEALQELWVNRRDEAYFFSQSTLTRPAVPR